MSDGGKGDKRRPSQISSDELKERWEAIFPPKGKKEEQTTGVGSMGEKKKDEDICPTRLSMQAKRRD